MHTSPEEDEKQTPLQEQKKLQQQSLRISQKN